MSGYQPQPDVHQVYYDGDKVNHLTVRAAMRGVHIERVHGWDSKPDQRDSRDLNTGRDGENPGNAFKGGRTITIEGKVYGDTWAELQEYKRDLAQIFYPTTDEKLLKIPLPTATVPVGVYAETDMASYERVYCRPIEGGVDFEEIDQHGDTDAGGAETFQVVLRASDPIIYSDTLETGVGGTSLAVSNDGRCEVPAEITVHAQGGSWGTTEVERLTCSTGGQFGFLMDRLLANDQVVLRTPEGTSDFYTQYHNGRLQLLDPVAYWQLNEAAGGTADNIEGTAAYDMAYTGAPTLNQSGHAATLESVAFNGTTQYTTVAFNANLNPSVFTLELWVKFDQASGSGTIGGSFRNDGANNTGWVLTRNGSKIRLRWYTGVGTTAFDLDAFTATAAATWYHVVAVLGESGAKLYINGVMEAAISYANAGGAFAPVTTASALTFGRATDGAGTTYLDGNLDGILLCNRELTNTLIANMYAASGQYGTWENYGPFVIEPSMTDWFSIQPGASTLALGGVAMDAIEIAYREGRL